MWNHFTRFEGDEDRATCNYCKCHIIMVEGSTSTDDLETHLKEKHSTVPISSIRSSASELEEGDVEVAELSLPPVSQLEQTCGSNLDLTPPTSKSIQEGQKSHSSNIVLPMSPSTIFHESKQLERNRRKKERSRSRSPSSVSERRMSFRTTSAMWHHFTRFEGDEDRAICNYCKWHLSMKEGSTSELERHLTGKHPTVPIFRTSKSGGHSRSPSPDGLEETDAEVRGRSLSPVSLLEQLSCSSSGSNWASSSRSSDSVHTPSPPPPPTVHRGDEHIERSSEKKMMSKTPSEMWNHFTRSEGDEDKATCNYCKVDLSKKGGSTGNLKRHLKIKHPTVPISWTGKERSRSRSPSVAKTEETNAEASEISFPSIFNGEQERCVSSSGSNPSTSTTPPVSRQVEMSSERKMATRTPSAAWNHFTRCEDDEDKAICNYCKSILSLKGGSTSNLKRHLIIKHPSVPLPSTSKERSRSRSPSIGKLEEADSEVGEISFPPVSRPEQEGGCSSGLMPLPSAPIQEIQRIQLSDTKRTPSPPITHPDLGQLEMSSEMKLTKRYRTTSDMWNHFTRSEGVDMKATCNYCKVILSIKGGSTNNLKRHLKMKHPSVPITWTSRERSRSRSPATAKQEGTDDELSFSTLFKLEQLCDVSSGSVVFPLAPSPPTHHGLQQHEMNGERKMPARTTSVMWYHFTRSQGDDEKIATCNYCKWYVSMKKGSTGNLKRHLQNKHPEVLNHRTIREESRSRSISPSELEETDAEVGKISFPLVSKSEQAGSSISGSLPPPSASIRESSSSQVSSDTVPPLSSSTSHPRPSQLETSSERRTSTKTPSDVWNHFTKSRDNYKKATCNHCRLDFSIKGGATHNLRRHLKIKHPALPISRTSKEGIQSRSPLTAKLEEVDAEVAKISLSFVSKLEQTSGFQFVSNQSPSGSLRESHRSRSVDIILPPTPLTSIRESQRSRSADAVLDMELSLCTREFQRNQSSNIVLTSSPSTIYTGIRQHEINSERKKPPRITSDMWNYFTRSKENYKKATCNQCKSTLSMKGGQTGNLKRHLKMKHPSVPISMTGKRGSQSRALSTAELEETDTEVSKLSLSSFYKLEQPCGSKPVLNPLPPTSIRESKRSQSADTVLPAVPSTSIQETQRSWSVDTVLLPSPSAIHLGPEQFEISSERKLSTKFTSDMWNHFTSLEGDDDKATCNYCRLDLSIRGAAATFNLKRHLKFKHPTVPISARSKSGNRLGVPSTNELEEANLEVAKLTLSPVSKLEHECGFKSDSNPYLSASVRESQRSRMTCTVRTPSPSTTHSEIRQLLEINSESKMSIRTNSDMWNHFTRSDDDNRATCNYCKSDLSMKGGPTGNLRRHLQMKHPTVQISRANKGGSRQRSPSTVELEEADAEVAKIFLSPASKLKQLCGSNSISNPSPLTYPREYQRNQSLTSVTPPSPSTIHSGPGYLLMSSEKKTTSDMWNHFTKSQGEDGKKATCKYCKVDLSIKGGSTGNLKRHLKIKHPSVPIPRSKSHSTAKLQEVDVGMAKISLSPISRIDQALVSISSSISNSPSSAPVREGQRSMSVESVLPPAPSVFLQKNQRSRSVDTVLPPAPSTSIRKSQGIQSSDTVLHPSASPSATHSEPGQLEMNSERKRTKGNRTTSDVWNHFARSKNDDNKSTCNYCKSVLRMKGGSTSNLKRHLRMKHPSVTISRKGKIGNRSRSPLTVEVEEADTEVSKIYLSHLSKLEQSCGSKSGSDQLLKMSIWERKRSRSVDTVLPSVPSTFILENQRDRSPSGHLEMNSERKMTSRCISGVWNHFTRSDGDDKKVTCSHCKSALSIKGSTSNLKRHLRMKHPTTVLVSRARCSSVVELEEADDEVANISNSSLNPSPLTSFRESQRSRSADIVFPPAPSKSIWENERSRSADTLLYPLLSTSQPWPKQLEISRERKMTTRFISDMWNHFNRSNSVDKKVTCNYCKSPISIKGGSTGNLKRHLKIKHPSVLIRRTRKRGSRSKSPSNPQSEEADDEVRGISLSPVPQLEQSYGSSDLDECSPSPSASIHKNKRIRLSTTVPQQPSKIHRRPRLLKLSRKTLTQTTSDLWKHFTRSKVDNKKATCNYCKSHFSIKGGLLRYLKRHLNMKHPKLPISRTGKTGNCSRSPSAADQEKENAELAVTSSSSVLQLEQPYGSSTDLVLSSPSPLPSSSTRKSKRIRLSAITRTRSTIYPGPRSFKMSIEMKTPIRVSSAVWHHFTRSQVDDKKATCNYCKSLLTITGKGPTSNLKRHLTLKHPSLPTYRTGKILSDSGSPPSSKQEEADVEVKEISFAAVSKQEQEYDLSSRSVVYSPSPSPSSSILENQRIRMSETALTLSPSTILPEIRQFAVNSFIKIARPVPLNKSQALDMQLTKMICKEFYPISIVEDVEFKKLLKMACPGYSLPSRKTISHILIPSLYLATSKKLKAKLESAKVVCITCDSWNSIDNKSFYAVTAHYFDGETKLNSNLIECSNFSDNPTAINTAEWLDETLNKWKIRNKIVAAVTYKAENIKIAVNNLNICHIACYAHALNLIMQSSIKFNINNIVTKIKRIVQYFKGSSTALAKLEEVQKSMNKPLFKLKQDVPTRWNSTFEMLNRALSNREPIILTMELLQCKNIDNLDAREWEIIEEAVKVLSIFEEATREICSDKKVSLAKTCFLSNALVKKVSQITSTKKLLPDEIMGLLKSLLNGLKMRFGDWESIGIISQSIFLDPRFKKTGFGDEETFEKVYSVLAEKLRQMDVSDLSRQTSPSEPQTASSSLWEEYDKKFEQLKVTSDPLESAITELDKYVAEPLIHRTCDPLAWWEDNKSLYPNLYEIAVQRLCIPATSVPCERIFSKAGQALNDRRSLLPSSKVPQIVFLNSNLE